MLNFTAIDFETATDRRNSACSVAVVEVRDGDVARTYSTLIRPPGLQFSSFNISIHGITPEMVRHERDFAGVWPELRPFLEDRIVIAHNAPFDMGVLKSSLLANRIEPPKFYHCCTVQISRKAWPELPNHKLDTVVSCMCIFAITTRWRTRESARPSRWRRRSASARTAWRRWRRRSAWR